MKKFLSEYNSMLFFLSALIVFFTVVNLEITNVNAIKTNKRGNVNRSFSIAPDGSTLLMNGNPFRVLSGSFHYFLTPAAEWEARFQTLNASGLNAVQTIVAWNFHCPQMNKTCNWADPDKDIFRFFDLAQKYSLYVMLRLGPYICAGVDFGGLPAWLLKYDRHPPVRTHDPTFLAHSKRYYDELLPMLRKYLYHEGGPIIMVQIENEFGSAPYTDTKYLGWLRDLFHHHLGEEQLLYSTDGGDAWYVRRTAVPGVYQTIDFYDGDMAGYWAAQRTEMGKISPLGPPFNDEFYSGWDSSWNDSQVFRRKPMDVVNVLTKIMINSSNHSNMNMYLFVGGTSFDYWALGHVGYLWITTSSDYGAPINESGHITEMFTDLSKMMQTIPGINRPITIPPSQPPPLGYYGDVNWSSFAVLVPQSNVNEPLIPKIRERLVSSPHPLTMEELDQNYGFISYEVDVPPSNPGESVLSVSAGVYDYGMVYADNVFIDFLISGPKKNTTVNIPAGTKKVLIVVQNLGRPYNWNNDINTVFARGILDKIDFTYKNSKGAIRNQSPSIYNISTLPMDYASILKAFTNSSNSVDAKNQYRRNKYHRRGQRQGLNGNTLPLNAGFFARGTITIPTTVSGGTLLDMRQFQKGFVIVNGHYVGSYWTTLGPQYSLYCPPSFLNFGGENEVIIFEQRAYFKGDQPALPILTFSNINFSNKMPQ